MTVFRFLDRSLFRLVSIVTQLLILSAVAAGFYQVIARFVLESPADWSEAWTRASLIWTVMLGVALAFRQGAMLSVEMLHSFLGPRNKRWLEHVILVICVAFLGFMAWAGGQMTWRVRFQTMPSLEFSISWVYISIPIGMVLAILAVVAFWAEGPRKAIVDDTVI
ncbi:putative inner membrane transport protein [Pusillimonas sp. T7-7]|uniref:TRAP transporter small permease n=1 Tax=Pusillimonas sp. (strain T7-7) TaxID=1007105 RepID=UPI000208465E|nr:TRAP transporter small permease [Pusillimonas sp. T7-7]AEC21559.1 putative inner membrane transport protein [Pusillimonas sp. T7-7]